MIDEELRAQIVEIVNQAIAARPTATATEAVEEETAPEVDYDDTWCTYLQDHGLTRKAELD